MSDVPGHLERRAAQRFGSHLPLSVRSVSPEGRGQGVTQNLSARGAFFCTDFSLTEGDAVELTLVMPSEITLAENMRVRDRKSTRLNSSHSQISYAVFCLKKKKKTT